MFVCCCCFCVVVVVVVVVVFFFFFFFFFFFLFIYFVMCIVDERLRHVIKLNYHGHWLRCSKLVLVYIRYDRFL